MNPSPANPEPLGLPPDAFASAFPFHFAVDPELRFRQVGRSLTRLCPDVAPRVLLPGVLRVLRPETQGQPDFAWLVAQRSHLVVFQHATTGLQFRGQLFLCERDQVLVFAGSPWLTDAAQLEFFGIEVADYPAHDPMLDILHVLQSQKVALADAAKLAAKLTAQRAELRATNERLRRQEAEQRKLALVAARTDNAVIVTDAEARIEWVNEGFTRITGYHPEEVRGRTPGSFLQGPDTDPGTVAFMRRAIRQGEPFRTEVLNYHRTGRTYWLAIEVQPIRDDEGRITNFMAVESDITARKRSAEALVLARDAAEAANRAKGEFLATMSHEIRTPMNGVLGMIELLRQTPLSALQREFADGVASSAHALLDIINDVLDFSRLEAGRLPLESVDFDLRALLDGVLENAAHRAPEKPLHFGGIVHHDVPRTLRGDPTRIRQILLNLVGNAVKFTERGEVVVRILPLERSGDGIRLRLEVRDTGIGLTAEQVSRLFQPFVQVDSSSARRYGGTGLGLAICRGLAQHLDGVLGVESQAGHGSTFWLELPLAIPTEIPPAPAPQDPSSPVPRVLVASAHPPTREALAEQLRTGPFLPSEAASLLDLEGRLSVAASGGSGTGIDVVLLDEDLLASGCAFPDEPSLSSLAVHWILLHRASAASTGLRPPFAAGLLKPVKSSQLAEVLAALREGRLLVAPPTEPAALPGAARVAPDPSLAGLVLLLVEDHPVNRRLCELVLDGLGLRADVAVNGLEAVQAVRHQDYDVVLMDCHLPELDGYEATRTIRRLDAERPPGRARRTYIIALTANALVGERERCLAAGMDDYLSKPLHPDDVAAMLRKWLGIDDSSPTPRP